MTNPNPTPPLPVNPPSVPTAKTFLLAAVLRRISPKVRDYTERIVITFLVTFAGSLTASTMFNLSVLRVASLAGLAAAFNVLSIPIRNLVPFLPSVGKGIPPVKM